MFNMSNQQLIEKWSVLDPKAPGHKLSVHNIPDFQKQLATAKILENSEKHYNQPDPYAFINESQSTTSPSSQANGQFSPVTMAIGRRVMPDLFAWKCVGVQPMQGPVGLAYAMRFRYKGYQNEAGFDDQDFWSTFTGNLSGTSGASNAGTGVATSVAEGWQIEGSITPTSPMPQLVYAMESVSVTAKTRKLAANISLEALADVQAMHGVDIRREMVERLQYEIRANIDRELLGAMLAQSINTANGGEAATTWQTSAADGRWQQEKFSNVANVIIQKANDIGNSTRLGSANFAIVSSRVATALQATGAYWNGNTANVDNSNAYTEIGTLNNQIKVYVDRFAKNDYALLGLKAGNGQNEAGVIFSPYMLGIHSTAVTQEDFSPRDGVASRYAVTNSLMGSGRYYRLINFSNLATIMQA